jgi:glutamate transport system substrate-binding protein
VRSRKVRATAGIAAAAAVALTLSACGGGGDSGDSAEGGGGGGGDSITIGTKFDQPGLGLKNPDGTMSGFDVDVATFVAGELGYTPEQIEWVEAPSAQRENLISNGQVQFIAATYSITDARKEKVDFAGPYLITGQSLLVRADNTDITGAPSLENGKRLCSVSGSTPAQKIKDEYAGVQLQQYDTYSACIEALRNNAVDAVTTDEVILAGYAAQSPGDFKIVGDTFSEERYGIGLKKDDSELRTQINDAIEKMEADGAWKEAFDKNLGPAGITAPEPPAVDRY